MRYTRVLGWSSVAAIAVSLAMPAHAADAADAAAEGGTSAEASSKDVIIVTATRQAADKQKVGVALTAITAEDIALLAPRSLLDIQGTAPNVFIGSGTAAPGQSAIFIRGQGYADVEKTQSPPVGVIQDGVFFGNNTGQLLDMFNVCSVEVDRGPQGIFYGKNTTAGLINLTRCAPTRKLGASFELGYGSFNEFYGRGVLNAPLGDKGGIAFSGQYRRIDGILNNVFTNRRAGGSEYRAFNLKVNYDLADWLNADLSLDHIHQEGGGTPVQFGNKLSAAILSGGNPAAIWPRYNPETGSPDGLKPREIGNNLGADRDRLNTNMASLILKAKTPIGELVSQTSYMSSGDTVNQDFDGTCRGAAGCTSVGNPLLAATGSVLLTNRDQTYKQFTQEVRLQGKAADGLVDYIAGAYYYNHKITLHQNTNGAIDQFSAEKDHSWSFFGNIDLNPTPTLKISGGVRNIFEAKRFNTEYILLGTIPLVPRINDRRSWQRLITRFNIQWQATPDVLLYANRSEGFRSGGFSIRGTLSEQQASQTNCGTAGGCPNNNFLSFLPETNTTYEAGFKTRFLNRAITFNAAGFINDIKDFQQSQVVVTPILWPRYQHVCGELPEGPDQGSRVRTRSRRGQAQRSAQGPLALRHAGHPGCQREERQGQRSDRLDRPGRAGGRTRYGCRFHRRPAPARAQDELHDPRQLRPRSLGRCEDLADRRLLVARQLLARHLRHAQRHPARLRPARCLGHAQLQGLLPARRGQEPDRRCLPHAVAPHGVLPGLGRPGHGHRLGRREVLILA